MTLLFSLLVVVGLVGVDQLTKYYAVLFLKEQPSVVLWDNVFELKYIPNDGIAFSLFEGYYWLIIPITALAMLFIFVLLWRSSLSRHWMFKTSCILILAGGVGNLIDRVVFGYVVDFLYFRLIDFPIFNVADCFVVIGAAVLIIFVLFVYKDDEEVPLRTLLFGVQKKGK